MFEIVILSLGKTKDNPFLFQFSPPPTSGAHCWLFLTGSLIGLCQLFKPHKGSYQKEQNTIIIGQVLIKWNVKNKNYFHSADALLK